LATSGDFFMATDILEAWGGPVDRPAFTSSTPVGGVGCCSCLLRVGMVDRREPPPARCVGGGSCRVHGSRVRHRLLSRQAAEDQPACCSDLACSIGGRGCLTRRREAIRVTNSARARSHTAVNHATASIAPPPSSVPRFCRLDRRQVCKIVNPWREEDAKLRGDAGQAPRRRRAGRSRSRAQSSSVPPHVSE
jgi:hypothetical protein